MAKYIGCTWADEMFEDSSTGNEVIDLLMKKLGIEVGWGGSIRT